MDARTVIADRMKELGLTVARAARESGVNERTWRNVLADPVADRQTDTVAGIAGALRWRVDWLDRLRDGLAPIVVGGVPDTSGPSDLVSVAQTALALDVSDLTDIERGIVVGVLHALRVVRATRV